MEVLQADNEVAVGPWECYGYHEGAPWTGYDTGGDLWNQRVERDQGWGEPQNIYEYCKGLLQGVLGGGSEHEYCVKQDHKEGGWEGKWG